MMKYCFVFGISLSFQTIFTQQRINILNDPMKLDIAQFVSIHKLRRDLSQVDASQLLCKSPLRLWGGADIPEIYPKDPVTGPDKNDTALEWEVAEAEDWIGNTFTYLRNRWSGFLLELNHVRCGSFRISPCNEPMTTDGWAVAAPHLVDAGGNILPPEPPSAWRCPLVPELFAAARRGRRPGEPSAPMGPSAGADATVAEGPDPAECAARCYQMPAAELEKAGVHAGRLRIWPGSAESAARTAEMATSGLLLRDQPEFARFGRASAALRPSSE
jgi:hypothetical protein